MVAGGQEGHLRSPPPQTPPPTDLPHLSIPMLAKAQHSRATYLTPYGPQLPCREREWVREGWAGDNSTERKEEQRKSRNENSIKEKQK